MSPEGKSVLYLLLLFMANITGLVLMLTKHFPEACFCYVCGEIFMAVAIVWGAVVLEDD